jgi:hypothetical protein
MWNSVWVLSIVVAAGIVMTACQSAQQPAQSDAAPQGQGQGQGSGQGQGFGGGGRNFQMEPAKELPTTSPIATGVFVQLNGGTLVIQEGNPNFRTGANGTPRPTPNGTPRPRPTPGGGTEVQVTVASDAVVYHDITFASLNGQPPSGTVQQKLEAGSLSSIQANSRVTIWGEQNGDQITAKVIVYSDPFGTRQQP